MRFAQYIFIAYAGILSNSCSNSTDNGDDFHPTDTNSDSINHSTDTDTDTDSDSTTHRPNCATRSEELQATTGNTIQVTPGSAGNVTVDGNTTTLRAVIQNANSDDTILLADGEYTFHEANAGHGSYTGLYFTKPNVTMRSQSGNAAAVVLDSNYVEHGDGSSVISVDAEGVELADFTVKRSVYHLIHFWSKGDSALVHNVRLVDGGQQFIKASGDEITNNEISCSELLMTADGRSNVWGYGATDGNTRCYTGGIDTHNSSNWHIHDNRFVSIHCDATPHPAHGLAETTYVGGLAEHAIHMWNSPQGGGHIIERNQIINCGRGIGIGMATDVYDTVVRNNMVFSEHAGGGEHDVGINVDRGHNIQLYNNTVFFSSPLAYSSAIEYRFNSTDLQIGNNLTSHQIRARDGAVASLNANVSDAQGSWFANPTTGDLHLASCSNDTVVSKGKLLSAVQDDFDQEPRTQRNDVGADQCND